MRTGRFVGGVAAASAALLCLTGCFSSVAVPPPATTEDATENAQAVLDATYELHNLDGQRLITSPLDDDYDDSEYDEWSESMNDCMSTDATEMFFAWNGTGYEAYTAEGEPVTGGPLRQMYECAAEHPLDARAIGLLYTTAEREYLWEYYQRWVLPCLASEQIELLFQPTRDDFLDGAWLWSPYDSIDYDKLIRERMTDLSIESGFGGTTDYDFAIDYRLFLTRLQAQCGPQYANIRESTFS